MSRRSIIPTRTPEERFEYAMKLAAIKREQDIARECEESLRAFVDEGWKAVAPGTPFIDNWHIDAICEHLEALLRRDIRNLIINLPPRSLKSSLISVMFPAWVWLTRAHEKILSISYSRSLSLRDSRRARALIMSQWYQSRWADKFALVRDQNEKGRFENTKGGYRLAGSIEGGVLGEGGTILVLDDPNDLEKMQFPEYRESCREFYSNSLASRNIDPKTDVRLCVQQRASYGDDMTAYLMSLGGWEQLVIPCEYQGAGKPTSIGWTDPRTHVGELMHPERLGPLEVQAIKAEMRANFSGQFNQQPRTDGGGNLAKEWFNFYNPPGTESVDELGNPLPIMIRTRDQVVNKIPKPLPDAFEQIVHSWDMAFKDEEQNSKVAGHAWGRVGANTYLMRRDTEHRNFPETLRAVRQMSAEIPCAEKLVEGKANGPAVIQTLRNEIPGLIEVNPEGGKYARVAAISGYVEAGNVWLPNPNVYPWVWKFLDEVCGKPEDDTDAMTQALKRLYDSVALCGVPEFRVQPRAHEPATACHIATARETGEIQPHWRRFLAVVPNGGVLWLIERPSGTLLVTAEMGLEGIDAEEAGRRIARHSFRDILMLYRIGNMKPYELFFPKLAFAPMENGCWAELCEAGFQNYIPEDGDYELREQTKATLKAARVRFEQAEEEDSALDRLRMLMAFAPPDFKQVPYNRATLLRLSREDLEASMDYMAQVAGEVRGEWPKLKIAPACKRLVAEIGAFRRDKPDEAPALVRALLLAVAAPSPISKEGPKVVQWPAKAIQGKMRQRPGMGTLLSKRFSLGRR